jgi:dTDP-4-dehydrorhamnose reductase
MNKILVTGSTGLLGGTLITVLKSSDNLIITHANKSNAEVQADISDIKKTFKMLDEVKPDIIINLVGQISVELCQENPNIAYLANTKSVENLVSWIESGHKDCHLIQISTDHIYDGEGPHTEEVVTLTNNYAFSKYAGELAAKRIESTILRTNFIGRSKVAWRESLTDWVYRSLINKKHVQVLDDVFFSPLSMLTLSKLICLVVAKKPVGIFNLGSRNSMSKAEFDFAFADYLDLDAGLMTCINSKNADFLKAYRPKDMSMDSTRFEKMFNLILPDLIDEMKIAAEDYLEKT